MLVVVALGGNALVHRGEPLAAALQRQRVRAAAQALAPLCREHRVVLTHGNGPQVGLLALQSEAFREVEAYPLDVLSAETQGMVGYWLQQELAAAIGSQRVVTLLTQVEIDATDPALHLPRKPIGPVYTAAEAQRLAAERGWQVAPDGHMWRRVVASPAPRKIVELEAVRILLREGYTMVCGGGGGVPVIRDVRGRLCGVEAVVDKDRTAALLATELDADRLLILTDVAGVLEGWPGPDARVLRRTTPQALRQHAWDAGSMGPKVEAAADFVAATGRNAAIGALDDAAAVLAGHCGTTVCPDD